MTAVSYSSANSVSFLNRCLRFIVFSRLIHVLYVNGWIAGCCFYLGNELQQQYGDVHLREMTHSSPRKGKVGKMYFLFDILLERADQKETWLTIGLCQFYLLLLIRIFFEVCVLCIRNETNINNCPNSDLEINYCSTLFLKGICFVYISIFFGMYAVEK